MPSERHPVRFGLFEVNLDTGEVRRAGVKVRIQEQPFQVLAALLEKPGEIVTKEELQERLWKDDTFVDFDRSLATAINKVRQALGDSAIRPRFIETVAKRGYRFIGGVGEIGAAVEAPPSDQLRVRLLAVALALSLLALLAVVFTRTPTETSEKLLRRFSFTSEGLLAGAISPDGNYVAYSAVAGGRTSLWVRSLATETSRELAGTEGVQGFFWSPDSLSLGFAVLPSYELKRISIDGGSPLTLCDLPSKAMHHYFMGGTWSPDGERIIFSSRAHLYEIAARGGQPQLLFDPGDDPRPTSIEPHFLPTGQGPAALVYTATARPGSPDSWLTALNLETGERRELGPGRQPFYSPDGYLLHGPGEVTSSGLWALPFSPATLMPTGEGFPVTGGGDFASVSLEGTLTYWDSTRPQMALKVLVWRTRAGEILEKTGQPQAGLREFELSPDGRFVVTTVNEPSDIWIQDLTRAATMRLTVDPVYEYMPTWRPSGNEVSYTRQEEKENVNHLVLEAADGAGKPITVLDSDYSSLNASWSRDGRYVVFQGAIDEPTRTDILYAELNEGSEPYKPKIFLSTPAIETAPKLSSDGRFVAYVSDESGRPEVYVRPFPPGDDRWQASFGGGTQPRWRRDGKELFYVQDSETMMAVPISTEQGLTLGQPQRLFESADLNFRNAPWPQYDISADGQRFLTSTPVDGDPPPTMRIVQNWYEEFRGKNE